VIRLDINLAATLRCERMCHYTTMYALNHVYNICTKIQQLLLTNGEQQKMTKSANESVSDPVHCSTLRLS